MKKTILLFSALLIFGNLSAQDKAALVNPIIGTNGMGHTFPGACVPFGLVQLSPDTDTIPQYRRVQPYAFQRNRTFRPRRYPDYAGYRRIETESRNGNRPGWRLPFAFLTRYGGIPSRLLWSDAGRLRRESTTDGNQAGGWFMVSTITTEKSFGRISGSKMIRWLQAIVSRTDGRVPTILILPCLSPNRSFITDARKKQKLITGADTANSIWKKTFRI